MRLELCIDEQEGIDQCAVITTKPDLNFLTRYFACVFERAGFLLYVVNRHLNYTGRSAFLSQKYRQFYSLNSALFCYPPNSRINVFVLLTSLAPIYPALLLCKKKKNLKLKYF